MWLPYNLSPNYSGPLDLSCPGENLVLLKICRNIALKLALPVQINKQAKKKTNKQNKTKNGGWKKQICCPSFLSDCTHLIKKNAIIVHQTQSIKMSYDVWPIFYLSTDLKHFFRFSPFSSGNNTKTSFTIFIYAVDSCPVPTSAYVTPASTSQLWGYGLFFCSSVYIPVVVCSDERSGTK